MGREKERCVREREGWEGRREKGAMGRGTEESEKGEWEEGEGRRERGHGKSMGVRKRRDGKSVEVRGGMEGKRGWVR